MAKLMRVEVTLNAVGKTKVGENWPEGVANTITMGVPIPDNFKDFTPAQLEVIFKNFKGWNTEGKGKNEDGSEYTYHFIASAPKIYDALVEGLKVQARKEGNALIQENVRVALGKPKGVRGKKSTVTMG